MKSKRIPLPPPCIVEISIDQQLSVVDRFVRGLATAHGTRAGKFSVAFDGKSKLFTTAFHTHKGNVVGIAPTLSKALAALMASAITARDRTNK